MKAADIPDETVLLIVGFCEQGQCGDPWGDRSSGKGHWANRWIIRGRLHSVPPKVVDAKLRSLVRRGLLTGCDQRHNCRGDFELVRAC